MFQWLPELFWDKFLVAKNLNKFGKILNKKKKPQFLKNVVSKVVKFKIIMKLFFKVIFQIQI